MSTTWAQKQKGFTIVELLIAIVIIAILVRIAILVYDGIQFRAAVAVLKSDLKNSETQLAIDDASNGEYPGTEAAANGGKGLPKSPGTAYQYTLGAGVYCLSASSPRAGTAAFHISSSNSSIEDGVCAGHTEPTGGSVAITCPSGFIVVPGSSTYGTSAFCVMKFEAKNVGDIATSEAAGTPWVDISQTTALSAATAACTGCHLITEAEWLTITQNVLSVSSNWSGGSVGSGYIYSGHNDNEPANALAADTSDANGYSSTGDSAPSNQRRTLTLTNGEVIWDLAGNVFEWTSGTASDGKPGDSAAGGYQEWNAIAGTGSLSPNPFPSYGTPAASGWTSAQGIGQVYSDSADVDLRGFLRGGVWFYGGYAGVLTLDLSGSPSGAGVYAGFRVSL